MTTLFERWAADDLGGIIFSPIKPAKRPKPSEAEIQREIDLAIQREGLCICRAVALDRARAALARRRKQR
jgi:hypothetical protein